MIGPMPDYMKTPEWKLYRNDNNPFELKDGAPEWLKKAVEEHRKQLIEKNREQDEG